MFDKQRTSRRSPALSGGDILSHRTLHFDGSKEMLSAR